MLRLGITELERVWVSPRGLCRLSTLSFTENMCDEGGRKKFAVPETKRRAEVVEILPEMRKLTVERKKAEAEGAESFGHCQSRFGWQGIVWSPKLLKVKLDLQEQQSGGALRSWGSVWGPMFCEECWGLAEKEAGTGAERVGRHAGVRIVTAERYERGCGREQGGGELHSQCGEQFGWMA